MNPRLLKPKDVAEYLSISTRTLSRWVRDGKIPGPVPDTGRYDRVAIDKKLDSLQHGELLESPLQRWRKERENTA